MLALHHSLSTPLFPRPTPTTTLSLIHPVVQEPYTADHIIPKLQVAHELNTNSHITIRSLNSLRLQHRQRYFYQLSALLTSSRLHLGFRPTYSKRLYYIYAIFSAESTISSLSLQICFAVAIFFQKSQTLLAAICYLQNPSPAVLLTSALTATFAIHYQENFQH